MRWGVKREHIMMLDSKGVIYKGRTEGMNKYKEEFVIDTDCRTLADAVRGADVFYGLSIANVLTPEMVKSMAKNPFICAMANPDPEIRYELAKEAPPGCDRGDRPFRLSKPGQQRAGVPVHLPRCAGCTRQGHQR